MNNLLNKKCVPCEGGMPPLSISEVEEYLKQLVGWSLVKGANPEPEQARYGARIWKEYKFKDFIGAINFVNKISEIAEGEGHHPDMEIHYNKVKLTHYTHALDGLSENDFILAAKIDTSQ